MILAGRLEPVGVWTLGSQREGVAKDRRWEGDECGRALDSAALATFLDGGCWMWYVIAWGFIVRIFWTGGFSLDGVGFARAVNVLLFGPPDFLTYSSTPDRGSRLSAKIKPRLDRCGELEIERWWVLRLDLPLFFLLRLR